MEPNPTQQAIVILGSPNDETGRLSPIATSRLGLGLDEFRSRPGSRILLTGGFGPHFNRAPRPHADYARGFLLGLGVPESAFLEAALSSTTVEDAILAGTILRSAGFLRAVIVTSDFHIERARYLFGTLHPWLTATFSAAPTPLSPAELAGLEAHESVALEALRRDGILYRGQRLA